MTDTTTTTQPTLFDKIGFPARNDYVEANLADRRAALEADKVKKGRKNTKATAADLERIRASLSGEWASAGFQARVAAQHEDDWLTTDPVWNPKHPLHATVNRLIEDGATVEDAIARAEAGEQALPAFIASEKQVAFIESLLAERDFDGVTIELIQGTKVLRSNKTGKIADKKDASNLIDVLKAAPRKAAPVVAKGAPVQGLDLSEVPAGLYAVPNGETRLKVSIEHGKPGSKWEGWTFVKDGAEYGQQKRYGIQRPGQTYQGEIVPALEAIKADPMEAMKAYGKLTGRCGRCNRKLEDETSVAEGIGPICKNL